MRTRRTFLHVTWELDRSDLPEDCIEDCAGPGPADNMVAYWRSRLGFTVERVPAIACLVGYGAWTREELEAMSDIDIAETILWIACGNFKEGEDLFVLD